MATPTNYDVTPISRWKDLRRLYCAKVWRIARRNKVHRSPTALAVQRFLALGHDIDENPDDSTVVIARYTYVCFHPHEPPTGKRQGLSLGASASRKVPNTRSLAVAALPLYYFGKLDPLT